MQVALFVPCYIDQLYPRVAVATLELLEKLGCDVAYPLEQTCCGQPMANAGFERDGDQAMRVFARAFDRYDYVVAPSGSCVLHIREHIHHASAGLGPRVYELCDFLIDVLAVERIDGRFPHRVGLHESCHGLRGLRLGRASELNAPAFSKPGRLLEMMDEIEMVKLDRGDECCGFGGTFAVSEEAVSVKMGRDRIRDHESHEAEVITGTDMSCLMHLEGLIRRENHPLKVMHVAEILNWG